MARTNSMVHRDSLVKNVPGSSAKTPLGQMEKNYYSAQSGISGNSLSNQRQQFLKHIITTNGKVPQGSKESDLVKQALVAKSLPVTKFLRQNWRTLELSL